MLKSKCISEQMKMYFWGNENIFAWPLLAVCGLRLSALLVRGHTSQEVAAEERKRRKKKKGLCRPGEERKENSNQKQSKEHTEKSEECEKNLFLKTTFFAEKYSCEKVWRINENEWRQYPIVVFHSRRRKVGWISEKREQSYFGPNYEDEPETNSKLKSWMRCE